MSPYPAPTPEAVAEFRERGWLALRGAVPAGDLLEVRACCQRVEAAPERLAFDPSRLPRAEGAPPLAPSLHATLDLLWRGWRAAPLHAWARSFARALLGVEVELWYDQLLLKPPAVGAATFWHQDDAYLGGPEVVSCWLAVDEVDREMGCMELLEGGHRLGIIEALRPRADGPVPEWSPAEPARVVAALLAAGDATFHHGRTPHRAGPNRSPRWRRAHIQRFVAAGAPRPGGGAH